MPKKIIDKLKGFFGKSDEKWDWENFLSTTNYPVSPNLIDWIIGQEHAIKECKICIDEWINKLCWLKEKQWWKVFEDPMANKSGSKEMLPSGPFLLMLGDAGTGKSLLGRAMQNYMTELYIEHGIKLTDVVSWKNPTIPQEPKISIHPTPTGRDVITKANQKTKKQGWFGRNGLKFFMGMMISIGAFLFGLSMYLTINYMQAGVPFAESIAANTPLLVAGGGLMFSGIFVGLFGRILGNLGNNQQGIGGASTSGGPKLLIDNSNGRAPFIDATGHGSSQLFGSIAWDPYQTGGLGTPEHQRVTVGDVHRAHLGILFIDEIKNLTGQEAITLLTVLEDGQLSVALRSQFHGGDSISGDSMMFYKDNNEPRYNSLLSLIKAFEAGHQIEVLSPSTMDFHTKSLVWTKVLNVYRRGIKPVKKLTLISGKQIELTEDHSLFSYNHGMQSLPLIPATIKERDRFITVEKIYELPVIDKTLTKEDLEFYGFWIADGSYDKRSIAIACGKDEKDKNFIQRFAYLKGVTASDKGRGDIRIFSVSMVREMQKLGFVGDSYTKRIPQWIFFLPRNKKEAFINGYLRGDGCEYKKDGKMIIQFSSVNRELLEDFQTLFNTIGITTSVSNGRLNGKLAFKSIYRQYKLTSILERSRNQGVLSLHRTRKLEDNGEKEVFDLKIVNECFIANGILCHNTAAMAVATEPIPCMNFLIAAGNLDSLPQIHPALLDRIQGYGKMVYMSNDMPNTIENRRKYVQFISQEVKRFHLLPLSRDACMAVIEEAVRRSGKNNTITCKFRPMISVIKTSSVLAQNEGKTIVERKYVDESISEHCKSIALQVMEKYIENQSLYNVLIDPTEEPKIGQIHGLAVSTINAQGTDFVGSVLTIRASCLQKDSPKKAGYFTVTGVATKDSSYVQHSIAKIRHVFLQLYGVDVEQDCCTHIDFAQNHGVEGPSAGITMTLALASVLLQKKIRQDVAVTGEINIASGDIQTESSIVVTPIGGAHEKILAAQRMGFKKVCIPLRNFEKNINPSDYTIEVVGCSTINEYIKECFVDDKDRKECKD